MKTKRVQLSGFFFLLLIVIATSLFSDGFIIVRPHPLPHPGSHYNHFSLAVRYHRVNVSIDDNIAVTKIDQVFFNPTRRRLEGYYMFPIPNGAVIRNFSMYINGKETPAELLDSAKARRIYENIVRKMRDPALLEYAGKRMFRLRIFPIEPRSEKRVKISYSQILRRDGRTIEYTYPLNTEKFSSAPVREVSIYTEIRSSVSIGNIYCPTHKTEIVRKSGRRALVTYEESNSKPDRDFRLYFDSGKKDIYFSLKTFKRRKGDGFFLMNITPSMSSKKSAILPKNVIFVLDVSGSMSGKKLEQAKKALKFCVNSLRKKDRFNIIRFSTEAESLFEGLRRFDLKSRKRAISFIEDLRAIGGTNIEEALEKAVKNARISAINSTIIFITDGKPTIGLTSETGLLSKIKKINSAGLKIFTFGVGNDINTHLLDKITTLTGAYRTYISPDEDIEIKISNFYTKIESPVLISPGIKIRGRARIRMIYPKRLPDLFKGTPLTVIGRYSGSGTVTVLLNGKVLGEKRTFEYRTEFPGIDRVNDYIPKLWAARRIGFLLDQIRLNGEEKELKDEVIRLARKYGIVTPYTSFLIVEDEKRAVRRREIFERDTVLAPAVVHGKVFEDKAAEERLNFKKKSGFGSVRASKEVQNMYNASDYSQISQGSSRLALKKDAKSRKGLTSIMKDINGRTFYFTGKFWVDPLIRIRKPKSVQKIKFGTKRYFEILSKYPALLSYFSLGKNIRVIFQDILFEVEE